MLGFLVVFFPHFVVVVVVVVEERKEGTHELTRQRTGHKQPYPLTAQPSDHVATGKAWGRGPKRHLGGWERKPIRMPVH